jgi:hypothetical protein
MRSCTLLASLSALILFSAPLRADDLAAVQKRGDLRVVAVVSDPKDEFMTAQPGVGSSASCSRASRRCTASS